MLFEPAILSVLQSHDVMLVFQKGLLYDPAGVYLLLMEVSQGRIGPLSEYIIFRSLKTRKHEEESYTTNYLVYIYSKTRIPVRLIEPNEVVDACT